MLFRPSARVGPVASPTASPTVGDFARRETRRPLSGGGEGLQCLAARGDAELAQQALHVRADRVLGDEQAPGDLVGAEVLVEQEQNLDLAGAQLAAIESGTPESSRRPSRTRSSSRRATAPESAASPRHDAVQELGDPLGRLGLEQVAGSARPDRGEQVLLGARSGEDDDLARRGGGADTRQRLEPASARHRQVEEDEVGLSSREHARPPPRRRRPRRPPGTRAARAGRRAPRSSAGGRRRRACAGPCRGYRQRPACRQELVCGRPRATYLAWVRDELVLVGLLSAALTLFLAEPVPARPVRPAQPAPLPRHGGPARLGDRLRARLRPLLGRPQALRSVPALRVLRHRRDHARCSRSRRCWTGARSSRPRCGPGSPAG